MTSTNEQHDTAKDKALFYIDMNSFSTDEYLSLSTISAESRKKVISSKTKAKMSKEEMLRITPMNFKEELCALSVFLFGVPGSIIVLPTVLATIGYMAGNVVQALLLGAFMLIPLSFASAPFVPKMLSSWYALQILRYFSFKCVYEEPLQENKPYILVAPPHGVFPFGNILTMIAFPSIMGFSFYGLASSVALRVPVFRQLLCTIGAVDADRETAFKYLNANKTIGISTGGVAEVFETDSKTGDEVVVLRSRKGLVKLAMRTGASIVPCYLFGNTKLYSQWYGGTEGALKDFNQWLSRKIGVALVVFWGRFILPVPYRVPIVGVMSKPIAVEKNENPTDDQVAKIHQQLMDEMVVLFDTHKASYGWADKKLLIK